MDTSMSKQRPGILRGMVCCSLAVLLAAGLLFSTHFATPDQKAHAEESASPALVEALSYDGTGEQSVGRFQLKKGVCSIEAAFSNNAGSSGAEYFDLWVTPENPAHSAMKIVNQTASSGNVSKKVVVSDEGWYSFEASAAAASCVWSVSYTQPPPQKAPSKLPTAVSKSMGSYFGQQSTESVYLWPGVCSVKAVYSGNADSNGAGYFGLDIISEDPAGDSYMVISGLNPNASITNKITIKKPGWYFFDLSSCEPTCNWSVKVTQAKQKVNIKSQVITIKNRQWTNKRFKPASFTWNRENFSLKTYGTNISYGVNKDIGKGSVIFTGKGEFKGTTTVFFKIVPKKTSVTSIVTGKKKMTVAWKKASAAQKVSNYQVRYRAVGTTAWKISKDFPSAVSKGTIGSLKKGKFYEVQVRSYKAVGGENYFSPWSATRISAAIL